jgi:hypothetical protein
MSTAAQCPLQVSSLPQGRSRWSSARSGSLRPSWANPACRGFDERPLSRPPAAVLDRQAPRLATSCDLQRIARTGPIRGRPRATVDRWHHAEPRRKSGRTLAEPPICTFTLVIRTIVDDAITVNLRRFQRRRPKNAQNCLGPPRRAGHRPPLIGVAQEDVTVSRTEERLAEVGYLNLAYSPRPVVWAIQFSVYVPGSPVSAGTGRHPRVRRQPSLRARPGRERDAPGDPDGKPSRE